MNEISKLIFGLSIKQRISVIVAALLVAGGILAFTRWKHEGDFRPLYTSMAPEDAATVVQKLRETGVEYRLTENGAAVLVQSAKLAESRLALAAAGLPKTGRIGFELFDKTNFGATEFVEHINYKRALEGELERSVMSLAEVEQARVHLTLPKESVFLDQQQPAKASVLVKLRPGAQISQQNVLAVTNLVASAVEGLTPQAVSLLDMDGTLLSRPKKTEAGSEITAESMELREQLEHRLVSKINATLEPLLGASGFRAGASVDCDLTSGDQQEETLDPTRSVMVNSQKSEETSERTASTGIPGTAANLPTPPVRPAPSPVGTSRRTENTSYQTSRVVKHTHIPQGVIRRMSLAVLVGQNVRWEGTGATRQRVLVPPAPETLKTIKDLVAGVTGFSTERGDQLIVETLPFESALNATPPAQPAPAAKTPVAAPAWLDSLTKNRLAIPIAAGVVLLLVLGAVGMKFMRRKKKPVAADVEVQDVIEMPATAGHLLAAEEDQRARAEVNGNELIERVREAAHRDIGATTNVLRMWLQERETSRSET